MTTTESYGCDKHGEDAYQGCAMCDLETLRERLHEAELVAASWKREAELNEQAADESSGYAKRLAEAEALLREESHAHYCFTQMTEYPAVTRMLLWHMDRKRRIDTHLAQEEKP